MLIRGDPGLGKSQIARAIAAVMRWRLVTTVVNATMVSILSTLQADFSVSLAAADRRVLTFTFMNDFPFIIDPRETATNNIKLAII